MATLFRVVNQQLLNRSILIDKIDFSTGNTVRGLPGQQRAKQAVYVPFANPLDLTVKGYLDMIPTDEVLLSMNGNGTLARLQTAGYVSVTGFSSSLTSTPVISAATHAANANIGGQTGTAASITTVVSGVATVTGLTGMSSGSVGHDLLISGAASGGNNGTFRIVNFISATSVKIANAAAVASDANNGAIVWHEQTEANITITGTTMASLSPDHTYVTVTSGGTSVTLTDTQIAADAGSSFSTSSIKIAYPLLTALGAPAAGWTVQVQANSKKSNTFTTT